MKKAPLVTCIIGGIWLALAAFHDRAGFFRSYLFAYLYWLSLPLGALGLLMTMNLTGGRWGKISRDILEAMTRTTLGFVILFLPILAGLDQIFPWASAQNHAGLPSHKAVYLNVAFFIVRTCIYFALWLWLARFRLRMPSGGGLIVLGFTVTFAAVDWQMSLEPTWYSTIYGMIFGIGQALQAWAFAIAVLCTLLIQGDRQTPADIVLRDIGNILLTLVILWAYLSFMQYLIIWSGNLPEEASWVLARTKGGWQIPAILLAGFQFMVPFSALLLRSSKERLFVLRVIAIGIVAIRVIEQYWMVMPAFSPERFLFHSSDIAAWLTIGGFWLWLFLGKLGASRA